MSVVGLQVDGLWAFPALVRLHVVGNLLVFHEAGQARSLNGGDMDEDVRTAIVGLDEAEAFFGVEEFDRAGLSLAGTLFLRLFVSPLRAWQASLDARKRNQYIAVCQQTARGMRPRYAIRPLPVFAKLPERHFCECQSKTLQAKLLCMTAQKVAGPVVDPDLLRKCM